MTLLGIVRTCWVRLQVESWNWAYFTGLPILHQSLLWNCTGAQEHVWWHVIPLKPLLRTACCHFCPCSVGHSKLYRQAQSQRPNYCKSGKEKKNSERIIISTTIYCLGFILLSIVIFSFIKRKIYIHSPRADLYSQPINGSWPTLYKSMDSSISEIWYPSKPNNEYMWSQNTCLASSRPGSTKKLLRKLRMNYFTFKDCRLLFFF